MRSTCQSLPEKGARRANAATSASEILLGMVIVRRSIAPANAIAAGNTSRRGYSNTGTHLRHKHGTSTRPVWPIILNGALTPASHFRDTVHQAGLACRKRTRSQNSSVDVEVGADIAENAADRQRERLQ